MKRRGIRIVSKMLCLRVFSMIVMATMMCAAQAFLAPLPLNTRQLAATRRNVVPFDQSTLMIAARGPEAIQEDPFLVGLALSSIVLLVFVTGGTIYLTAAEQRDPLKQPEKPKLPTYSELGGNDPLPEGANRYARRMQKKKTGKASRQKSDNPF